MEQLTHDKSLSKKLRLPAHTRTQKLHNVSVALSALPDSAGNVLARSIADGNLEATLDLVWRVIFTCQLTDNVLDEAQLSKEVEQLKQGLGALFRSHPPLEDRIRALQAG